MTLQKTWLYLRQIGFALFWFICLSEWLSFQIFHLSLEFFYLFSCYNLHYSLIDWNHWSVVSHVVSPAWYLAPCLCLAPKEKPPAALVMATDLTSLAALWCLPQMFGISTTPPLYLPLLLVTDIYRFAWKPNISNSLRVGLSWQLIDMLWARYSLTHLVLTSVVECN